MAKNIQKLADLLGAKVVGQVPHVGGGAFGAALLAKILQARLQPGRGQCPAWPTDPSWSRHPEVPMSEATECALIKLAERLSTPEQKVSPMHVAAHLLEEALANYRD